MGLKAKNTASQGKEEDVPPGDASTEIIDIGYNNSDSQGFPEIQTQTNNQGDTVPPTP